MGNLLANPSTPPVPCFPNAVLYPSLSFLCENKYWPVIHSTMPFILYSYFQNAMVVALLMYAWESFEAIFEVFFNGVVIDQGTETLGDSVIGDIVMGLFGISIGYLTRLIFRYNHAKVPPMFEEHADLWFKYIFQIVVLAAPTGVLYQFSNYFAGGLISIMYLVLVVYVPTLFGLFAIWNRNDITWKTTTKIHPNTQIQTSRSTHPRPEKFKWYHISISIGLLIYYCLFIYRWWSVFYMALVYNGLLVLLLSYFFFAGVHFE